MNPATETCQCGEVERRDGEAWGFIGFLSHSFAGQSCTVPQPGTCTVCGLLVVHHATCPRYRGEP